VAGGTVSRPCHNAGYKDLTSLPISFIFSSLLLGLLKMRQ
jgi:hypothetical protein